MTTTQRALRVLFATAELRPLVSAGGLGEAAAGLVAALRAANIDVTVALPAYQRWVLAAERRIELDVPDWAAPAAVTFGIHPQAGSLALIEVPDIARPDPYVDDQGEGWPDNELRFARFACAVAALAALENPDVVHLNDWHTALAPAFLTSETPTVLTIHNLAHQGWTDLERVHDLPRFRAQYTTNDAVNYLAGAVQTVDKIVAVSPNYAREILEPSNGFELDELLAARAADADLVGIVNGIDTEQWNPVTDTHTPRFAKPDDPGKADARSALLQHVGWEETNEPVIVMVTRLVDQKGVDLALEAGRWLAGIRARLVILGSGAKSLADQARLASEEQPDRLWFHDGYDVALSHLLFAGGDLLLMPSRFEPCGLAQMQAMAYGTIPVVTPVGGLIDTVVDADLHRHGNGFVTTAVDVASLVDGLHRAVRAWRHPARRRAIQRRGMEADWSWQRPAASFIEVYTQLSAASPTPGAVSPDPVQTDRAEDR